MKNIKFSDIERLTQKPQTVVLFALSFEGFQKFFSRMHDAQKGSDEEQGYVDYTDLKTLNEYIPTHWHKCDKMPLLNTDMWHRFAELLPIYGNKISVLCVDKDAMTISFPRHNEGMNVALVKESLDIHNEQIMLEGTTRDMGSIFLNHQKGETFEIDKFINVPLSFYQGYFQDVKNLVVVTDSNIKKTTWEKLYSGILDTHENVIFTPSDQLLKVYDIKQNLDTVQKYFDNERKSFYDSFTSE